MLQDLAIWFLRRLPKRTGPTRGPKSLFHLAQDTAPCSESVGFSRARVAAAFWAWAALDITGGHTAVSGALVAIATVRRTSSGRPPRSSASIHRVINSMLSLCSRPISRCWKERVTNKKQATQFKSRSVAPMEADKYPPCCWCKLVGPREDE